MIRELAQLVKDFPGEAPVLIEMETSQGPRTLALGPDYRVEPAPDFFAEVKALLGPAAVALEMVERQMPRQRLGASTRPRESPIAARGVKCP